MVFKLKKQTISDTGAKRGRAPLPIPTQPRSRSRSTNRKSQSTQSRDPSATRNNSVVPRTSSTSSRSSSTPRVRDNAVTRNMSATRSVSVSSRRRSNSLARTASVRTAYSRTGSVLTVSSRTGPPRIRYEDPQTPGLSIPIRGEMGNRFVEYTEFGSNPMQKMRVISINEVPALNNPSDVVVKVKASLVSLKDCYIRRGIWPAKISLPNISGFELVGSVIAMGADVQQEGVINIGDAVGACVRNGGNARYAVVPSRDLVQIPGGVDSAQAASVITNYMTAYQALHRVKPRGRKETLEGSNILVTGGNGPIGQAIIELGFRAGANKIFVTAEEKFHAALHEQGVCPLPLDATEWLPLVKGKMDIVIDGICQDGYASPRAALNKKGHLIITGMTLVMNASERGWFGTPMDASVQAFATKFMTQTTSYDPYESSQNNRSEWKHDLDYLMQLLERKKISPSVTKRITLDAVPTAQKELEAGNVNGLIVCKPWK